MSELDEKGNVLATFTDVVWNLGYLSTDSRGHILVADSVNNCILLLNSELQLERVLLDGEFEVELHCPLLVHYNELTAQLYVVHPHEYDCCLSDSSSDEDGDSCSGYDYGQQISIFSLSAH